MAFFGSSNLFGSTATAGNTGVGTRSKDPEVQSPPTDTISCLRFSPGTNATNTYLAATSWDNRVRVWEVMANGATVPKAEQMHQAPAFATCWSNDGTKLFSTGADKTIQMWDLASNQFVQVGAHDAPVKTLHFVAAGNYTCLISGGWDKILKFWDARQPTPIKSIDLPERVYCSDVQYPIAIYGFAGRQLIIYNLENGPTMLAQVESQLTYQNRCISIFMDKKKQAPAGYALGSIEGRVAINYFQPLSPKDNFTFKCHRSSALVNGYYEIYAVNDLAFHPIYGTLATVGSDGRYSFWDKDARTKIRGLENAEMPLNCCAFDAKGQLFAYASGYDWSKGHEYADPSKPNKIFLHPCLDEMKPSAK